ncbi:MAG: TonB family protein [Candidatus Obscuribacterales bacterium]|nr:TonB family protein [Candidatus Obscuribacterales bacterium]
MQFYSSSMSAPRDPGTAATLSLVPGLGQFYNGQSRKGILFLDVALINAALLCVMAFTKPVSDALSTLGQSTHMKLNSALLVTLQQIQLGTPGSLVILGLFAAFVAFSVRDAYDNAMKKRRRAIYGDSILDLTEATSGSYIFHVSLLLSLAIMALFFCVPQPAPRQFTEIEFMAQKIKKPEPLKKPVNVRDLKDMVDHGRVINRPANTNATRPLRPSQDKVLPKNPVEKSTPDKATTQPSASSSSSAPPHPTVVPRVQPAQAQPSVAQPAASAPPRPTFMPKVSASSSAAPNPNPLPASLPKLALNMPTNPMSMPSPSLNIKPAMPAPPVTMKAANSSAVQTIAPVSIMANSSTIAAVMPLPAGARSSSSPGGFANPSIHTGPLAGGNSGGTASVPSFTPGSSGTGGFRGSNVGGPIAATSMPAGSGNGTGSNPVPRAISGRPGGNSIAGPGSNGPGVVPSKSTGSGTHSGPVIVPTGGGPQGALAPDDGGGMVSPRHNTDGLKNAREAQGTPDFTAYMQDLQRRIKRAWFPSRTDLSNRVVVLFKVHSDGSVSDVSIRRSSGITRHDNAALTAVQNAAPFPPLPKYSPDAVDIEFTFDYNVFSGGR